MDESYKQALRFVMALGCASLVSSAYADPPTIEGCGSKSTQAAVTSGVSSLSRRRDGL